MNELNPLFRNNRRWAESIKREDPDFFKNLSKQQSPDYLWIGCSDSRVPANQIMGLAPGEVFVHRNIANVVVHSDLNCLSVIQYAVDVLKVKHIIVTGHYDCGGVAAAMSGEEHGLIDNWLGHIRDVYRLHKDELDKTEDKRERYNRLCELNVIEQVANVCNTTSVQRAWKQGQKLAVHGCVYSLTDGIMRNMKVSMDEGNFKDGI